MALMEPKKLVFNVCNIDAPKWTLVSFLNELTNYYQITIKEIG